jgi:2-hydroxy-3-oxopropionate reductase
MAERLAAAGMPLRVWNRTAERAAPLGRFSNVQISSRPSEAVSSVQMVIVMLSTGEVVDGVLFAQDNRGRCVSDALDPSSTVIVMSSIPVSTARAQADRLRHLGVRYIDAPVSGGEAGAKAASLTVMAGGEVNDVEAARPVLERFGKVTHVGPVGSGQLAKLANQLIVGVTIGAVAEALLLAGAGGADAGLVCQALQGGFADSTILRQHGVRMVTRSFEPGGHATTQLKDLSTAGAFADERGLRLPFLTLAEELYQSMCDRGIGDLDHSALFLELERRSRGRD